MKRNYRGVIIAESLDDPTLLNAFLVYKARITEDNMPLDYEGNTGRWHIYYVRCSRDEIEELQQHVLRGWYAHFWKGNKIIVLYNDKRFEILQNDKSTWKQAIEHGRAQGIPENELDFPTV